MGDAVFNERLTDAEAPRLDESGRPLTDEQFEQLAHSDLLVSAAFAKVVSILMRSPLHKHYSLADLEWLALPAVLLGQFALLEESVENVPLPVPTAVAMWACVSPEIDAALSRDLEGFVRLRPNDWNSGENIWLIDAIGEHASVEKLIQQIQAATPIGRRINARVIGPDGKLVVVDLSRSADV